MWETLTREEKRKFQDLLRESGYKYDALLGTPMPISAFGTREMHDGLQSYSKIGRKLQKRNSSQRV